MNQREDSIRAYLKSIGKYPLLSAAEEIALGQQIQGMLKPPQGLSATELALIKKKGLIAKEQMVSSNLRLVVAVAKKFQNRGLELLDLIQEGSIGLLTAVEKFDPKKGFKFSTYAYHWIRQAIRRAIHSQSRTIRVPSHIWLKLDQIKKAQRQLSQELKRKPTLSEIGSFLEMSDGELLHYVRAAERANPASLSQFVNHKKDTELGEMLPDPESEIPLENLRVAMLKQVVASQLSELKEKHRLAINLRYGLSNGESQTFRAVAEQMGLSGERVRQIVEAGSSKLREQSFLKEFLEA